MSCYRNNLLSRVRYLASLSSHLTRNLRIIPQLSEVTSRGFRMQDILVRFASIYRASSCCKHQYRRIPRKQELETWPWIHSCFPIRFSTLKPGIHNQLFLMRQVGVRTLLLIGRTMPFRTAEICGWGISDWLL